jgi:hypothetical protein
MHAERRRQALTTAHAWGIDGYAPGMRSFLDFVLDRISLQAKVGI